MMPMRFNTIQVRPLAPALGAEIGGVDLSHDLSDGVIAEIRQALLNHLVIFFRGQDITPARHLAFARRFGDLVFYPMVKGLEDYPEIVPVVKRPDETDNFGGVWHSDTAYLTEPPLGAILVVQGSTGTPNGHLEAQIFIFIDFRCDLGTLLESTLGSFL